VYGKFPLSSSVTHASLARRVAALQRTPSHSYQRCGWVPWTCATMPAGTRGHTAGNKVGFLGLWQALRICSTRSRAASDKCHRIVTRWCAGRPRVVPLVERFLCEPPPPPSSRPLPAEHRVTKAGILPHTSPSNVPQCMQSGITTEQRAKLRP
jgi:hypothetical protein